MHGLHGLIDGLEGVIDILDFPQDNFLDQIRRLLGEGANPTGLFFGDPFESAGTFHDFLHLGVQVRQRGQVGTVQRNQLKG
ncbi:MAG: hypothetical protein BWY71_01804 [Planctomycetes bacterium ADurb.Bin412]|nr:MAG: hypothetical protein BWY71_01804 [Planctomycetes bacterium ADurb.Bin412]